MGAAVITLDKKLMVSGNCVCRMGTGTLSSSYATGGDTWTARNFGLGTVDDLEIRFQGGWEYQVDYTGKKILAYSQGITTGATAAPAASTRTGALALNDAGTEGGFRPMDTAISTTYKLGGLKEVASAVDLTGASNTFRWTARGVG